MPSSLFKVVVLDYGIGNLDSVCRALRAAGGEVDLTGNPDTIAQADRLVIPGVGAFGSCADALRGHDFEPLIHDHAQAGKPLLGICVGMQLLFTKGLEFGEHDGLNLLPGVVAPIAAPRIPHIGWNALLPEKDWTGTLLHGLPSESDVYFVHSFAAQPDNPDDILATTNPGAGEVVAAVQRGNVMGVQFHPEKSGPVGRAILRNFLTQRN